MLILQKLQSPVSLSQRVWEVPGGLIHTHKPVSQFSHSVVSTESLSFVTSSFPQVEPLRGPAPGTVHWHHLRMPVPLPEVMPLWASHLQGVVVVVVSARKHRSWCSPCVLPGVLWLTWFLGCLRKGELEDLMYLEASGKWQFQLLQNWL